MSLTDNYDATVKFLSDIRQHVENKEFESGMVMDLSSVRTLGPAAALCLVAELDRWQRFIKEPLKPITVPQWRETVRHRLNDLGFFELLGTRLPERLLRHSESSEKFIQFTSGVSSDGSLARKLREGFEQIVGGLGLGWHAIYRPLIEAMNNAVEHAYTEDFPSALSAALQGKRWWLAGATNASERCATVLFFDQGIGIARSVERQDWLWKLVSPIVRVLGDNDGRRIAAAIEVGQSRSRLPNRGKGLHDMVQLAGRDPRNRLRIISHSGLYEYRRDQEPLIGARSRALQGTLIQWDLYIPSLKAGSEGDGK